MSRKGEYHPQLRRWTSEVWPQKKYASEISALRNAYDRTHQRTSGAFHKQWKDYGGRGIGFYEPWIGNFDLFMDHIGPKPSPEYTLDRIDNDSPVGYAPGNVRWTSRVEQQANTRFCTNKDAKLYPGFQPITANGETHTLKEWCAITPLLTLSCFRARIRLGWDEAIAATTPVDNATKTRYKAILARQHK